MAKGTMKRFTRACLISACCHYRELKLITKMPACFTFQSYNDVAEDMRGDEDTKAELHQQLDVRNTNTYSLFRYSVRYYIELLPGKNSCKRIFVI